MVLRGGLGANRAGGRAARHDRYFQITQVPVVVGGWTAAAVGVVKGAGWQKGLYKPQARA